MSGLVVKVWSPAVNPAQFGKGRMVVLHGRDRFAPKFALVPGVQWSLDHLPRDSLLRERQVLGMTVSLQDVPRGRHFAVPLGKSPKSPVLWWMCPCGSRFVEHKAHWTDSE